MLADQDSTERLWITWNTQRRNETLSAALNAEMVEFKSAASNWLRYPLLSFKTVNLIRQKKPSLIFAQNPSLALALLVTIYGKILRIPVIIDAHNAGIYPLEGRSNLLNRIALGINSLANIVIVSNENLRSYLQGKGIRSAAIADPIPDIKCSNTIGIQHDKFNIVYVSSWAADEPYQEVIEAASKINDDIRIYITGKPIKSAQTSSLGGNITLTGYLTEDEYNSLLCNCDAIMVLTTRENCLLCGAYEGVAVSKPLILSETKALKEHFCKGAVYTKNKSEFIIEAIHTSRKKQDLLTMEIEQLKQQLTTEVAHTIKNFNHELLSLM